MIAHEAPHRILNLLQESWAGGLPRAKRHISLEDVAPQRIGFANNSRFGDRGVMQDCAFDFEWSDAVSGALDDIVGAALEPKVSGLVTSREIARGDPAVAKELTGSLRVFPIAKGVIALVARALRQISHFTGRQLKPVVIDDGHLKAGHRQTHGAGLYLDIKRVEIAEG
jgi:hypothetical protein